MAKRSACLIFNPIAGNSNPERDLTQIKTLLEPEIDLDIQMTQKDVSVEQLTQEAIAKGAKIIIASGGDGTLSAVASVVMNTEIPLGIISRGTANAFAAALNLPNDIQGACQTILEGYTQKVDAARCNDQGMVLLAGIGFEAETVQRTKRETKKLLGPLAYIVAGIQQLQELESFQVQLETEERTIELTAAAVTVANAAPPTSILAQGTGDVVFNDGLLDITIVAPQNTTDAITASYHLLRTALQEVEASREDIISLRTRRVKVVTTPPQEVTIDGEVGMTTPLDIECIPHALTLLMPESAPTVS